jgi:N4-gp56 family major capsid protein
MPVTPYTTLEDDTQSFYDRNLLERALPALLHDKFGQERPLQTRSTRKKTFRRWSALTPTVTALSEGVTPIGSSLAKTDITVTLKQFGDYVTVSDVVQWASRDAVLTETAQVLGEQAGQSLDQVYRDVLVAGTSVFCLEDDVGTVVGTTRTNVDGLIHTPAMRLAVRYLQLQNAKPFTKQINVGPGIGSAAVLPSFWGIVHPAVYYTLRTLTGFVSVKDYAHQTGVMSPWEVGNYQDIRFCMSTHAKVFADAGANVASGHESTTGVKEDVFATLIFAMNAYGIVPMTGHSMENIVKPLGSAGTADPLNQRATSGWKAYTNAIILNDAFMTRIESGAISF